MINKREKTEKETLNPLNINLEQNMTLDVEVISVSTTWKDIGVSSCNVVVLHLLPLKET